MWLVIIIALSVIILYALLCVMIYGKSIVRPDFSRVDEKLRTKTGFSSGWNTWFGMTVYYVLLFGLIVGIGVMIYAIAP